MIISDHKIFSKQRWVKTPHLPWIMFCPFISRAQTKPRQSIVSIVISTVEQIFVDLIMVKMVNIRHIVRALSQSEISASAVANTNTNENKRWTNANGEERTSIQLCYGRYNFLCSTSAFAYVRAWCWNHFMRFLDNVALTSFASEPELEYWEPLRHCIYATKITEFSSNGQKWSLLVLAYSYHVQYNNMSKQSPLPSWSRFSSIGVNYMYQ